MSYFCMYVDREEAKKKKRREEAGNLDLEEITCMFVAANERRTSVFGHCVTTLIDNLCTMVQFLFYNLNW